MPNDRRPAQGPNPQADAPGEYEGDDAHLDADALARQRALTDRLRTMFDAVAQEPIPDDFLDLLNKLSDDDPSSPPDGGGQV